MGKTASNSMNVSWGGEDGERLGEGLLVSDVVKGVEVQVNKPELFRPVVGGPNAEVKCGTEVSCCDRCLQSRADRIHRIKK